MRKMILAGMLAAVPLLGQLPERAHFVTNSDQPCTGEIKGTLSCILDIKDRAGRVGVFTVVYDHPEKGPIIGHVTIVGMDGKDAVEWNAPITDLTTGSPLVVWFSAKDHRGKFFKGSAVLTIIESNGNLTAKSGGIIHLGAM